MLKAKILSFLTDLAAKKLAPLEKKREKITAINELSDLDDKIKQIKAEYQLDTWMEKAANQMSKQLSFATHLSKAVHPDSKGNNIAFKAQNHTLPFVGSHLIDKAIIDASGNAAALPLAALFDLVIDEQHNLRLRDLLLEDSPLLDGVFSDDEEKSTQYKTLFQQALITNITKPVTYERNKQLLWPNNRQAISEDNYTCLIPLYPSSLAHLLYNKIQDIRYSEHYKEIRENRKKEGITQQSYPTIKNLATIPLGGAQPQNISQLNSRQRGKHYLLPSLPPVFSSSKTNISDDTLFNRHLYFQCQLFFNDLFAVVSSPYNVYTERDKRDAAIENIIEVIFSIAQIYQQKPAGWSKNYQHLDVSQKYWLDPERANLDGEAEFKTKFEKVNWQNAIAKQFAHWVNYQLKQKFPNIRQDFSEPEFNEWRKAFKRALKRK